MPLRLPGALFTFSEMLSGFEFLGGLIVVVGLFYIVYSVGLWTTESWGWWTGMITNGIDVLNSFRDPVFLAVSLAVMAYLYSVRELRGASWLGECSTQFLGRRGRPPGRSAGRQGAGGPRDHRF